MGAGRGGPPKGPGLQLAARTYRNEVLKHDLRGELYSRALVVMAAEKHASPLAVQSSHRPPARSGARTSEKASRILRPR